MDEERRPETLASDAERAAAGGALQQACVEGRLTLEEFSQRVALAHAARTRGQLDEITRDLPAVGSAVVSRQSVSSVAAILSGDERSGPWRIGDDCRTLVVLGSCKLDLRGAVISSPVTTINARVIMGSLEVIVPEGVEAELEMSAFMSGKVLRLAGQRPDRGAPLVRITGSVFAGSVTIRNAPTLGERLNEQFRAILDQWRGDAR